jgi:hypothetical protein
MSIATYRIEAFSSSKKSPKNLYNEKKFRITAWMACGTVIIAGIQTLIESVSAKNTVNQGKSVTRRKCGYANLAGMRTIII